MNFPVFDFHCDTADYLAGFYGPDNTSLRSNKVHIDLDRGFQLPGYAQCFACFTTTDPALDPVSTFEKKLAAIHRELDRNYDCIRQAFSAKEIEDNYSRGIMSAILAIEGPAGFGFDPELLEDLFKIGFRFTTLGWNEKNPLTGSHLTGGGLTNQGREYVHEAQRLGMLVDVSHISDEGFWDIMDITQAPVIASHSNSRAVHNVSRNITDEMFLEICKTGGVVGINLYPAFLGENASLDSVCDHIIHLLELDPTGKHIALGGDLDGIEVLPAGFTGIQDYSILAGRLLHKGLTEDIVMNIFWNNALEVMKNAVCKH